MTSGFLFGPAVAKVHRHVVDGSTVAVTLDLIADGGVAELAGGEQFVTLWSPTDLLAIAAEVH